MIDISSIKKILSLNKEYYIGFISTVNGFTTATTTLNELTSIGVSPSL
jgi:hypothetical protein